MAHLLPAITIGTAVAVAESLDVFAAAVQHSGVSGERASLLDPRGAEPRPQGLVKMSIPMSSRAAVHSQRPYLKYKLGYALKI